MKRNVIETALGAFVLLMAVAFFLYGTGKADVSDVNDGYTVTAQFSDVGGLNRGDDVKISGVPVGSVADIALDPILFNASVTLLIRGDVKLPYDTAAKISSEGLLGGTYLALEPGADSEILENGDVVTMTQSAQNLEQLLGNFIFSMQNDKSKE